MMSDTVSIPVNSSGRKLSDLRMPGIAVRPGLAAIQAA